MFDKILNNKKTALVSRIVIFLLVFLFFFIILSYLFKFMYFSKLYVALFSITYKNELFVPYDSGFYLIDKFINITEECNGYFELALFMALILATIDVGFKKRLIGALLLIPLFILFNYVRILIIINSLFNLPLNITDELHTILFKLGLLVFFGLYYYFWLRYGEKNEKV